MKRIMPNAIAAAESGESKDGGVDAAVRGSVELEQELAARKLHDRSMNPRESAMIIASNR